MTNKRLVVMLSVISLSLFIVFLIFKFSNKKAAAPTNEADITFNQVVERQTSNDQQPETGNNSLQGSVRLTKEEVAKHNTKEDCWIIVKNKVYDITDYVSQHPGGSEILRACGIDATTLFNNRQTSSGEQVGSGTPHSSSAQSQLEQFLLGDFQQ